MVDRVVIVQVEDHLLCLPFSSIDEILGMDRIAGPDDLPEKVNSRRGFQHWVNSRGTWLPVVPVLPGSEFGDRSQIVIVRSGEGARAYMVDQVRGIESPGKLIPFPAVAEPYTTVPIAGMRLWKGMPLLELDLSRLMSLDLGGGQDG